MPLSEESLGGGVQSVVAASGSVRREAKLECCEAVASLRPYQWSARCLPVDDVRVGASDPESLVVDHINPDDGRLGHRGNPKLD